MEHWGVYMGYYRNPLLHSVLTTRKFVATLHKISDGRGHELAGYNVTSGGPRIIFLAELIGISEPFKCAGLA